MILCKKPYYYPLAATLPPNELREDSHLIIAIVDPQKMLDLAQKTDYNFELKDVRKAALASKYPASGWFELPEIKFRNGRVSYEQGRHRTFVSAQCGLPAMPMLVDKSAAQELLAIVGARVNDAHALYDFSGVAADYNVVGLP